MPPPLPTPLKLPSLCTSCKGPQPPPQSLQLHSCIQNNPSAHPCHAPQPPHLLPGPPAASTSSAAAASKSPASPPPSGSSASACRCGRKQTGTKCDKVMSSCVKVHVGWRRHNPLIPRQRQYFSSHPGCGPGLPPPRLAAYLTFLPTHTYPHPPLWLQPWPPAQM